MALAEADKQPVGGIARTDVEATFVGLKRFIRDARWIGKTNRYSKDVVDRLTSDHPLNAERSRNLAQYIAVSPVLHSSDGWSYLGRSIGSLMSGDAHRALHLAYYAELRAGMSLLAGAGIGIFKRRHFIISGANRTTRLQTTRGTHEFAWAALEFWSQQPSSGTLFARLIRPEGRPLSDWFQSLGGSGTLAPQAKQWFLQWGMDLRQAAKDRDARNESSYRPDGIPSSWVVPASEMLVFVQELWSVLEPSEPSSFEEIDRHILRVALERHFTGLTNTGPSEQNQEFVLYIKKVVADQGFAAPTERRWTDFLLRKLAKTDPAIFSDSARSLGDSTTDHLAVIARAVLLLRVATGSAHDLLRQAGFHAPALEFWWRAVGEARGLWEPTTPPASLGDLWADVNDALNDIQAVATVSPNALNSVNGIAANLGKALRILSSHERVGLWGLCPS